MLDFWGVSRLYKLLYKSHWFPWLHSTVLRMGPQPLEMGKQKFGNCPSLISKKSPMVGPTFHGPRKNLSIDHSSIATYWTGSVGIRSHSIFGWIIPLAGPLNLLFFFGDVYKSLKVQRSFVLGTCQFCLYQRSTMNPLTIWSGSRNSHRFWDDLTQKKKQVVEDLPNILFEPKLLELLRFFR